jgi:predicted NAD-dependent protein-ADP-ribosyltransferase YbiA (DUF1768 family)
MEGLTLKVIKRFEGNFCWLNNNFEMDIPYDGIFYPSVTHAFFAARIPPQDVKLRVVVAKTPLKQLGGLEEQVATNPDWEPADVMRELLETKFGYSRIGLPGMNMTLMKKLVETGESKLEYGNWNHSVYWGVCHCAECVLKTSNNVLGGLLMGVRKRWINVIGVTNQENITCRCSKIGTDFFLYNIGWNAYLMPYCKTCQVESVTEAGNLATDRVVVTFPRDAVLNPDKRILHVEEKPKIPIIGKNDLERALDKWYEESEGGEEPVNHIHLPHRHHEALQTPTPLQMLANYMQNNRQEERQWKNKVIRC